MKDELKKLLEINNKTILELEKESNIYQIQQEQRDNNWEQTKLEITEKIELLKNDIKELSTEIETIHKTIIKLIKNFKNIVKKTELQQLKNKIDSLKFEELATKEDLKFLNV